MRTIMAPGFPRFWSLVILVLWTVHNVDAADAPPLRLVVQHGHLDHIRSVALSPDGKILATGAFPDGGQAAVGRTLVWEVASGRQLRALPGECAVFHPSDSNLLATYSRWDLFLWDLRSGQQLAHKRLPVQISSLAFRPDGKFLVTASRDDTFAPRTSLELWEVPALKLAHSFATRGGLYAVTFTGDGKQLIVGADRDGVPALTIWEVASGNKVRALESKPVRAVAVSSTGLLASAGQEPTIRLWDLQTGKEQQPLLGHEHGVVSLRFSKDAKRLLSLGQDSAVVLWDVPGRKLVTRLPRKLSIPGAAAQGPNEQSVVVASQNAAYLLLLENGTTERTFAGVTTAVAAALDPRGARLATATGADRITVWDLAAGRPAHSLAASAFTLTFSPAGKTLLAFAGSTATLWDTLSGQRRAVLTEVAAVPQFDPAGQFLAVPRKGAVALVDANTGKELRQFAGAALPLGFRVDGKTLAAGTADDTVTVWHLGEKPESIRLNVPGKPTFVCPTADGKSLAVAAGNTFGLWALATGKPTRIHALQERQARALALSPDGKILIAADGPPTRTGLPVKAFDMATGQLLKDFKRTEMFVNPDRVATWGNGSIEDVQLPEPSEIPGSSHELRACRTADGALAFTRPDNKEPRCQLFGFRDGTWAVVDPTGRYDAANGGLVEGLHWVVGLEPIALAQLKERYYDPGLLAKHLGLHKEPLRKVEAFRDVQLFPTAELADVDPAGKLRIDLTNRGGGIGKVQVFINGKELLADARGPQPQPDARQQTLSVELEQAPSLKPGEVNVIQVVTWNAAGYLSSRGVERVYTPAGKARTEPPRLFAIVAGVSDYANPELRLNYAAKDAQDMALALKLGAKQLFGAEQTQVTLLTTGAGTPPTRANLEKAFAAARQSKPGDVLVVYLAGHGVALPGERDTYCYLTAEARSTDPAVLADPALLAQYAITSAELTEWLKQVPALKQVMILDTCAAGAAARKLTEARSVSGNQIRAIERLKDRTGFHVLMGCAADKVSYEATQYRQGLLTHALLKAMRGAALRQDEYVDVAGLFQYAADEVPQLARHIGGVQKPLIAAPRGLSFDIGRLTAAEKQLVPLASPRPLLLRPLLTNPEEGGDDNLGLMPKLRQALAEASSSRGGEATAVFVDADEMPGAIRPAGTYRVVDNKIEVRLLLRQDGKTLATITARESQAEVDRLLSTLVTAIRRELVKEP